MVACRGEGKDAADPAQTDAQPTGRSRENRPGYRPEERIRAGGRVAHEMSHPLAYTGILVQGTDNLARTIDREGRR